MLNRTREELHGTFPSQCESIIDEVEQMESRMSLQEERAEEAVRVLDENKEAIHIALGNIPA